MALAPVQIRANAGEPLDALVYRAIGRDSGAVETTVAATPGLALLAHGLPEGLLVTIPVAAEAPAVAPTINLWD